MKQQLEELRARFGELDALFRERALRERVLLAAGLVAVLFVGIDSFAIQPLDRQRSQVANSALQLRNELDAIGTEIRALGEVTLSEEEQRRADEIARLEQQVAEIDRQLASQIETLVSPQAVVAVLEEVLAKTPELELILLESRPPERIGLLSHEAGEANGLEDIDFSTLERAGLYRHGLRLELEGSFAATLDYLRRLEASRWPLIWQRLELRVQQFPLARISIDIHTVSEQEEWIGV